jgi:hypothetical protein
MINTKGTTKGSDQNNYYLETKLISFFNINSIIKFSHKSDQIY